MKLFPALALCAPVAERLAAHILALAISEVAEADGPAIGPEVRAEALRLAAEALAWEAEKQRSRIRAVARGNAPGIDFQASPGREAGGEP